MVTFLYEQKSEILPRMFGSRLKKTNEGRINQQKKKKEEKKAGTDVSNDVGN